MGKGLDRTIKVFAVIVAIAVITFISILLLAVWDFREIKVSLPLDSATAMTDVSAIEVSSNALMKAGKNVSELEPRPFDGTNFFARNIYHTNNGYVLWGQKNWSKGKDSAGYYSFSVHMEHDGNIVRCGVGKTK